MELKILEKIEKALRNGISTALITVIEVNGSTPASNGEIMAVWKDKSIMGTIGGGKFEYEAINAAVECIKLNQNKEISFTLTPENELGMQCGGSLKIYIKVFKPAAQLIIIGGGHIGLELYKLGLASKFIVDVFDDREEFCNTSRFPDANNLFAGNYAETLLNYIPSENSYIVIASKDHNGDKTALENLVNKNYNYLGMIGSRKKIAKIVTELIEKGVQKETLEKIYSPVGLDINSNEPVEVAIGIIAEILIIKNGGKAEHMKNIKKVIL